MKPALSVLFFTVLSGAGLGALALLALFDVATVLSSGHRIAPQAMLFAVLCALVMVVAGLVASTQHLANPRNAWRSATRWRTSWLSREALVALALLAVATLYAVCWWWPVAPALRLPIAVAMLLLAWATLFCTAMIYASLKPIRQWHTWRVPLNYLLLGHATGALLLIGVWRWQGIEVPVLTAVALGLFVVAALAKLDYWNFLRSGVGVITLGDAIGVAHGVAPPRTGANLATVMSARLLDVGHSGGTFLTREFMQDQAPRLRIVMQAAVWVLGFAVPILWLGWGLARWQGALLALLACLLGMLAERWLFFADARHTVRLFHGDRHT